MFKVEMDKKNTRLEGTKEEIAKGLCYYIEAIKKAGIELDEIKEICDYALEELKFEEEKNITNSVEIVYKENDFSIYKINTEDKSKEEILEIFKEILNKNQ